MIDNYKRLSHVPSPLEKFNKAIWFPGPGFYFLASDRPGGGDFQQIVALKSDEMSAHINVARHMYFAPGRFSKAQRRAEFALGAPVFFLDIDCGVEKAAAGNGYLDQEEARMALTRFLADTGLPSPTHVVNSGGGLHLYWVLDTFLDKEHWLLHARAIKDLTQHFGFRADPTKIADIACCLRLPGSFNHKYTPPRPVCLLEASDALPAADFLVPLTEAHSAHCSPALAEPTHELGDLLARDHREDRPGPSLDQLRTVLDHIDPDSDYGLWLKVLMGVYHETEGSPAGFDLVLAWSRRGAKFQGEKDIEARWRSFRAGSANPIRMGTLIHLAGGPAALPEFAAVEMEIVEDGVTRIEAVDVESGSRPAAALVGITSRPLPPAHPTRAAASAGSGDHLLKKFSMLGHEDEFDAKRVRRVPFLGRIARQGEITVIYGDANAGKTLITLSLVRNAIIAGVIDPDRLYYLNMDDSQEGFAEKLRIAEDLRFHLIGHNERGFDLADFGLHIAEMSKAGSARGTILVLDTLKKFVDTGNKRDSSDFAKLLRSFCMAGGTVLALGHTNKNPNASGKHVMSGTADIRQDSDCTYVLSRTGEKDGEVIVTFENTKSRGGAVESSSYAYSGSRTIAYEDKVISVREIAAEDAKAVSGASQRTLDEPVIGRIKEVIGQGINTKMNIANSVRKLETISKGRALKVLETYMGKDWSVEVKGHNANVYTVLPSSELPDARVGATHDGVPPLALTAPMPVPSPSASAAHDSLSIVDMFESGFGSPHTDEHGKALRTNDPDF